MPRLGFDANEALMRALLRCDARQAAPGCAVTARWLGQVTRTNPPGALRFHVREAVEVAHAKRIGHAVDAM